MFMCLQLDPTINLFSCVCSSHASLALFAWPTLFYICCLPCLALRCAALPCPALPCLALLCPAPVLPCPGLRCPAPRCFAVPCLSLPCPALSGPAPPTSICLSAPVLPASIGLFYFAYFCFGPCAFPHSCAPLRFLCNFSCVMRKSRASEAAAAELDLLLALAAGTKTFEQVKRDAETFLFASSKLRSLVASNPARGITDRLRELTGICKNSLFFFPVRCPEDLEGRTTRRQPFSLLSTKVMQVLAQDPSYFEVVAEPVSSPDVIASSFTNSPEYLTHDLVRAAHGTDLQVIPVGLYSDGVKVCCDTHPDGLYVIYLYFLHRPSDEVAKPTSKHLFTVYRKSESSAQTLEDIWKVLLWELQALASGCAPVLGEESRPLVEQAPGDRISTRHVFCLVQLKGDWAWYCEALGLWQWNSLMFMCPFCRACRDGLFTWRDFSLTSNWLATCRTHERFLFDVAVSKQERFVRGGSPFSSEPMLSNAPFFKWTMVKLDWQHAQDLGTLSHEVGEVWWYLLPRLAESASGRTKSDRASGLTELKRRLQKFHKEHRVDSRIPIRRLTLGKIKAKKHPKLKAKAVQTNRLVPFTLDLASEFRSADGDLGEDRFQSLRHVAQICDLASRRELTRQDLYNWRVSQALHMFDYARCGFHVTPKFHYSMHLPAQIERGGVPRVFWVYSDEGKNSEIRRLWDACSKGHSPCQQIMLRLEWLSALTALRAAL